MVRPFRFCAQVRGSPSADAWREQARRVEALGYSTLFMPDHVGTPVAPIAALTYAAAATTTLRMGAYVFGNDLRNPVMLAKEIASLDALSGGRVDFGLGTGWLASDYTATGIPFDRPGVRVDRFAEALQVFMGCFADGPFSFSGQHYRVENLDLRPKPVQRPHPPIVVGGGSPRVLGLAAREADVVAFNFRTTPEGSPDVTDITAEALEAKLGWVRRAAGDRRPELGIYAFLTAVTDREPRAVGEAFIASLNVGDRIGPDVILDAPVALIGGVNRIVETLQERRERYGISHWVVRDSDVGTGESAVEAFAPVVARLAGA